MINLQVCIPYQKCPFHCPMCIADNAPHFNNLYKEDKQAYFNALKKALTENDIRSIVLTGDTEPTLDYEWMNEIITFVKAIKPEISIELQTHVYRDHYKLSPMLDRACYSVTTLMDLKLIKTRLTKNEMPVKSRMVILATEEVIDYLYKNDVNFPSDQITFKLLQYTAYEQEEKDNYITENRLTAHDSRLAALVMRYGASSHNRSIVVDTNCQDSIGRYKIFREDGGVYLTWDSLEKE